METIRRMTMGKTATTLAGLFLTVAALGAPKKW